MTDFHAGDSFSFGTENMMIAGRVGWQGKEIWGTVILPKNIGNDVNSIAVTIGSNTIYACTYNGATKMVNTWDSVEASYTNGKNFVSLRFVFNSAPLSFNDGVVNIMVQNTCTLTFS